jgi:hypothetical protein
VFDLSRRRWLCCLLAHCAHRALLLPPLRARGAERMGGAKKKKKPSNAKKKKQQGGGQRCGPDPVELAAAAAGDEPPPAAAQPAAAPAEGGGETDPGSAWVKLIVRRGRVKTQEWVPAKILKQDKANDWVRVEAAGRKLQLKTAQVHIGATAPNDSTRTMEDATKLRREVSAARGDQVSSPVFRGPLPYENAVGSGWLARDLVTTREQLLLCTAKKHSVVTLTAVSHYESYISLLEHDILHVAADIERRATVVKSLQRSCRDHRRSAELERKHDAMVAQSQGYNVNVAALKAEAIAFRSSPITKKASIHVNHTWKKYGSKGEYMRKVDVEESEGASFEDLLSEMKLEDQEGQEAGNDGLFGGGSLDEDGGSGGGGLEPQQEQQQQISDPFISFGPGQWWWLNASQRAALIPKVQRQLRLPSSAKKKKKQQQQPADARTPRAQADAVDTAQEETRSSDSKGAEEEGAAAGQQQDSGMRKGFFEPAPKQAKYKTAKDVRCIPRNEPAEQGGAKAAVASSEVVSEALLRAERVLETGGQTPIEVFEEAVHHEMATLSNAKLSGCPCTLRQGEGYSCRCCSVRDAICKVMVLTGGLQTDHPFCYACLDKAHAMLSQAVGSNLAYVPLDTINYGSGTRALPDRQPMSVEEAKIRFRAKTARELKDNPLLAAVAGAVAGSTGGIQISNPNDQAKIEKLDRHSKSLVESPLTADHIDWMNGALAEEDKGEVRKVARERMAKLRRDAVLGFEAQARREGWGSNGAGVRSSVKNDVT